jgi:hypothetical protein
MPAGKSPPTQLVLVDDRGLGRIHVDIEAFFEFSFWLAEELEDMVANWQHTAAAATQQRRLDRGFDRR